MILKNALINAFATALYVIGVASLLFYAPHFAGSKDTVLIPIAILLLFVFSALFTCCMMVGRPVLRTALALLALFALRAAV